MPNQPVKPSSRTVRSGTVRSSGAFNSGGGGGSRRDGSWHDVGSLAPPLEKGAIVDGFLLEKRMHQGGMGSMWRVSRVDADGPPAPVADEPPLIMKVPRTKGGEDPATIVGYEVEQMIMPALTG
ncbi:MAG: hypothetical protein H7276_04165, partial [Caulobacter sp.]|nr:hypothetical protein [Vitreoscilla sp.]